MQYEIITHAAEATFAHKKVIGGGGEFAIVSLRLEPLSGDSGVQFINDVTKKVLPTRLVEGVLEGIQEASNRGVIAGHPVTDLRVTLIDGKYHDVDSNRRTFSLAARGAFWDAMRKADPRIQER
jgi:elongation factor G